MSEWWTYRPSDFLLFSSQAYYRLFELYNSDIWPMQLLAIAFGIAILALILRKPPWQGRAVTAILASFWIWIAWFYHIKHYSTINWAATYFAIGFAIQAALLLWIGVFRARLVFFPANRTLNLAGISIYVFALLALPTISPLFGRQWTQAEILGICPDPTVIATLGLQLLTTGRTFWELLFIPILWCVISGATLWTMQSPNAWFVLLAALMVIMFSIYKTLWLRERQSN